MRQEVYGRRETVETVDASRRPEGETAFVDQYGEADDLVAGVGFQAHGSMAKDFIKKSGAPKFPDFRARAMCGSLRVPVQGTPGSISGPIRRPVTPKA